MALTVEASGTQAATIGTEHTLHTNAGAKVFVLEVNRLNMVAGDELELRAYIKVLAGDSQEYLAYYVNYIGVAGDAAAPGSAAQGEVIVLSPPVPSPYSIVFTLKQVAGTGRNFPWNVLSL